MGDRAIAPAPVSEDAYLGGRLRLRQPSAGHRAGSDAILLAAAAPADIAGLALDVGAGVGAAGLALAVLRPNLRIGLLEKDAGLAALARDNLAGNGLLQRGGVYEADLFERESLRAAGALEEKAALVLTNPPFLDAKRVRSSPQPGKRSAHVMEEGHSLADWIRACLLLLSDGGLFLMIHRPEALPEMLAALAGRAGDIVLKPIEPQAERPAVRLLLRAKKGSRGPLAIAPPFVLHAGQNFTREAEAVHRGTALIAW